MAAASLLALIDDIATILDDVALLTKVATKKTAGVLGDDLALNAQHVAAVSAERELPVVWAVAKGSARNKAILVPLALAAGGLGIVSFIDNLYGKELLGLVLLGLSFVTSATSYRRWAANERSMRLDEPLPKSRLPLVIAVGTGVIGIAAAIFFAATEF